MTHHTSTPPAQPINPEATLNEIVAQHPQTLPVLQRFGLDTCCGGALPLHVAVQHHELNLDDVLSALERTSEGTTT